MNNPLFLVKWQDRRGNWRSKSLRSQDYTTALKAVTGDTLYPAMVASWGPRLHTASYQFKDGYEKFAIVEEKE